jgi:TolB-like protein
MRDPSPASTEVVDHLRKILASKTFAGSDFLRRLLEELVTKKLRGEQNEISEYYLAMEVFHRKDYDPQVHSIVRVQIRRLRIRLKEYYGKEGQDDPVQIEIPKGSYSPIIALPQLGAQAQENGTAKSRIRTRLAVLPFLDLSSDMHDTTFADAVTETLIDGLTVLQSVDVIGRTSVFAFKRRSTDIRTIGKELNVSVVLEGSVQRRGELVRITARLVSAETGISLRAKTFETPLRERLAAQERISSCLVSFVRAVLLGEPLDRLEQMG